MEVAERKLLGAVSALGKTLRGQLRAKGSAPRAEKMQAYMKSSLPYAGVPMPEVRALCRALFKDLQFASRREWEREVLGLFRGAEVREEWYAAVALSGVRAAREYQTPEAMRVYEPIIVEASWWDIVDEVAAHRVGPLLRDDVDAMRPLLLRWSQDDHLWRRRTAILSQLRFGEDLDQDFLFACIEPSIASEEFFLRKAIGWALREHAKVNPAAVKKYVRANEQRLSPLSVREAMKHL